MDVELGKYHRYDRVSESETFQINVNLFYDFTVFYSLRFKVETDRRPEAKLNLGI